ncbi:UNVERIFIED_CONTAM: Retrovirus-related Pol polyprotein from transposon TNT 1-94 [Sesamum angustifolium]|uniref:Retrovirus-related Pol polyprotein from transposon TNT 1-94 n=1 Tax=Sesamum angustifolium TaxID=2727405 RepID=A0AAW2J9X1_9LAMI
MNSSHKSGRTIWNTLESRYGGDDAGRNKYVVGKWLQFEIVDGKSIMDQVHEYENLVANVLSEDMKMCEILQANVLLEKFPPSWNDYRNHLKHKKRDLTLQELISPMRTEEANRLKDKEISNSSFSIKANFVEPSESSKDRFQHKGKKFKKNVQQKSHKENDGKIQKNKSVVVEAKLVENKVDWILDTGASKHFFANKDLFQEFHEESDGEVFMGNSATAGVMGKGKVLLKLTSGKNLALLDVLYVPSLCRNFISGSLLNKVGLKIVLESDKVIITRNGDFIGKGYLSDGLFVLNTISTISNKKSLNSAYMVESINIWQGGKKYYISFVDDYSRYTKIYLLRSKEEASEMFLKYKAEVENQLDKTIKRLRSDRGGEYGTNFFKEFCENNGVLEGFCDANWVTDNDEVSSTSGYVFTLGGGAISWKSAKQTYIARSTMESEFIALELAGQEVEWLRNLVGDTPLWGSTAPVSLHCDSQAAIGIAKNYAYNGKRRHIRLRHSAVKELLKNGIISLDYVRSKRNLADPLTKGLTRRIILETSRTMWLKPLE